MLAHHISDTMITIITDEGTIQLARKGKRAARVMTALNEGVTDPAVIMEIADPTQFIEASSGKRIKLKAGKATLDGKPLPELLSKRLHQFMADGSSAAHLVKFYERLEENPSKRAVDELYSFLEHGGMPITPEGKFLAYKSIRTDWTDHHTGTVSNKIGNRISMKRNEVCDDANKGCSVGFHAGSEDYACSFGGHNSLMVIVEIDPKDVVSVPRDCGCQKMRVCEYKVVGMYQGRMCDSAVEDSEKPYSSTVVLSEDEEFYSPEEIEVTTD